MDTVSTETLKQGGIGVIATDTLYGLVGTALSPATVERIYTVRHRSPSKPLIILLADGKDVEKFGISSESGPGKAAQRYWPGKISIILPLPEDSREKFEYLHRGTNTLAFRVPDKADLRELLTKTGPLVAPSANPEGKLPALDIEQARKYFGDGVDFYTDSGVVESEPSTLIEIRPSKILILREGAEKDVVKMKG